VPTTLFTWVLTAWLPIDHRIRRRALVPQSEPQASGSNVLMVEARELIIGHIAKRTAQSTCRSAHATRANDQPAGESA